MSSFTKIVPTKTELLRLKKRLKFLKKGHDLLKLKAESVLMQIKNFYQNVKDRRKTTIEGVMKAFKNLEKAEIVSGEHALKSLADVNKNLIEYIINIGFRSSLGFTVPKITYNIEREKHFPHYGFSDTNDFLDDYYFQMRNSIEELIELAELENTLFIMANEYRKLRRRINALESVIIPQTKESIQQIEEILEETALEEFIRLKKVKNKLVDEING